MAVSVAYDYEDEETGEVFESLMGPYEDEAAAEVAFRRAFPNADFRVGRPRLVVVEEIRPLLGYDQRRM